MSAPFLTVLTAPVIPGARRAYQRLRRALRPLVKAGVPLPPEAPYPGHYALTRSVVEGLRAVGADFNYNPVTFDRVARVVYAPAHEALCQAIELKQRGRVDYIVAGPVNALFPSDRDGILRRPEIDRLIVPSDWVLRLYRDEPALLAKTSVCPAGVDPQEWTPSAPVANRVVVYWKTDDEPFCAAVERIVKRSGREPVRIRYGAYSRGDFRAALDGAAAAVFLSRFETQGLALAEAWSMNVPTAVWNPCADAEWMGRPFQSESSCPYLTPATGVAWRALEELGDALGVLTRERAECQPRQWVLDNMTDAVCARRLFGIIQTGALSMAGVR
jgi:hypothetical protein